LIHSFCSLFVVIGIPPLSVHSLLLHTFFCLVIVGRLCRCIVVVWLCWRCAVWPPSTLNADLPGQAGVARHAAVNGQDAATNHYNSCRIMNKHNGALYLGHPHTLGCKTVRLNMLIARHIHLLSHTARSIPSQRV